MPDIAIVVPLYNEADVVHLLAERLRKVLPDIAAAKGVGFRLILVDDGSRDATVERVQAQDFGVPAELIVLSRNFGKEAALSAGLDAVDDEAAILMDGDLQHPPELISQLIEKWQDGYDVVYYFKASRAGEGSARKLASRLFYWLVNGNERFNLPANAGDFRLLDARAVEALKSVDERERFLKGLYAWIGFRQTGLPFQVPARQGGGGSRFGLARLAMLALDGLTSFSVLPIRLISAMGLAISALSLLYIVWIVTEYFLFGGPFSGFASIVVLVSFFGGFQIFAIGLIGEYVGKTLLEAKRRPLYLVRQRIDLGGD